MQFLAPGFAVFALLFGVPIAIHLIGRSRAKVKKFAAIELLLRSEKRVARRTRLRQILLLALRALAIAAVPLILARPFFETSSDLPAAVGVSQSAVIVLDDSLSMSYKSGRESLFDKARAKARSIVESLGADADAALLLASRGGGAPVAELTADRSRLLRALDEAKPSYRTTDSTFALKRAAQILQSAARPERRVYLISDLAAHGFDRDPPWAAGAGPQLVPVDVAGEPLPNRAVTDLKVEPAPQLGPRGVRVAVEIRNHGELAVKELPVTLSVDGKPVAKGLLDVGAHEVAYKRFFHTFAHGAEVTEIGVHEIVAEIAADGLHEDDRRYARVEVRRDLRVLVVDGDPRRVRRDDEIFYLENALRPGDGAESQLEVTAITPDQLSLGERRLAEYDVVFLCNVKSLQSRPLVDFVNGGGGLFITLGENVDPDSYNAMLGALLPQPLQAIRSTPDGERLEKPGHGHPVLAPLAPAAKGDDPFAAARFTRYALWKPTSSAPDRQVLMRFESGAPALMERKVGAGRVLVFASSIDRDWNDLAIQPIFLPLVQLATRFLARAPMHEAEPPALVGQRREIGLDSGDSRLEIRLPSGKIRLYDKDKVAGRKSLMFDGADEPGVYRVSAAQTDRDPWKPRPQATFVVNIDPGESDLARMPSDRLAQLAAGAGSKVAQAPRRRVELWHAMGAGLLLLLLGEALLLRRK
jgi:hypothetical protein